MHIIMKDATNRIIVFFKNSKKKKIPMNEEREREILSWVQHADTEGRDKININEIRTL